MSTIREEINRKIKFIRTFSQRNGFTSNLSFSLLSLRWTCRMEFSTSTLSRSFRLFYLILLFSCIFRQIQIFLFVALEKKKIFFLTNESHTNFLSTIFCIRFYLTFLRSNVCSHKKRISKENPRRNRKKKNRKQVKAKMFISILKQINSMFADKKFALKMKLVYGNKRITLQLMCFLRLLTIHI